jgi:hypothetical protein
MVWLPCGRVRHYFTTPAALQDKGLKNINKSPDPVSSCVAEGRS